MVKIICPGIHLEKPYDNKSISGAKKKAGQDSKLLEQKNPRDDGNARLDQSSQSLALYLQHEVLEVLVKWNLPPIIFDNLIDRVGRSLVDELTERKSGMV